MMNKTLQYIFLLVAAALLGGCASQNEPQPEEKVFRVTSSIAPFAGEDMARVNTEGTAFTIGDLIRIKIICPFVSGTQNGETTWGNTYDAFWLLKWTGSWGPLDGSEKFDINGDSKYSGSSNINAQIEAQNTPYVYTASTWATEQKFINPKNNRVVLQYTPLFFADQSREENYRISDILWAQTYMQTGTEYVHLEFRHVMAALRITLDGNIGAISDDAILTLEGMPDIDRCEIVVGDYYASLSKVNSDYGYLQKHSCTKEMNGKVLGIGVNDEAEGIARTVAMADVAKTGIYTALNVGSKSYRIMVPPCVLTDNAVFVLRDGNRRFKSTLEQKTFAEGTLYNVTITVPTE
ncbi:MAG: fimbrillin family protein [Bacteroidales bacterium]|nr:fimbrillin family protein [Bacteroidales bacterium]